MTLVGKGNQVCLAEEQTSQCILNELLQLQTLILSIMLLILEKRVCPNLSCHNKAESLSTCVDIHIFSDFFYVKQTVN